MKKISFLTAFLIILSFLLSSCKDEIVTPPPEEPVIKDSAMFDWEYTLFNPGYIYDLYAADTDKVFISASSGVYYYDGSTFTIIDYSTPDFNIDVINGTDPTNVYFGGGGTAQYITHARLKKWNGSIVQEIQMPDDSSRYLTNIFIRTLNEIWISTYSNKIYKYDGVNIETHYIPFDFLNSIKIFEGVSGNLYIFGWRGYNTTDEIHYLLEFKNNIWSIILVDTVTTNSELRLESNVCGSDLVRNGTSHFYYFIPNFWSQIPGEIDFEGLSFSGKSKDDFMCSGQSENIHWKMYVHRDGVWYGQSNYQPPPPMLLIPLYTLSYIKGYYFGIYDDFDYNYLVKARPRIQDNR